MRKEQQITITKTYNQKFKPTRVGEEGNKKFLSSIKQHKIKTIKNFTTLKNLQNLKTYKTKKPDT